MTQIFISYSREDSDFVEELATQLRRRSFRVWMDKLSIPRGSNWQEAIRSGVKNSAAMIAVVSPDSVASEWVGIEIDEALDAGVPVYPYVYRKAELPLRLKKINTEFHHNDDGLEALIADLPDSAHLHRAALGGEGLAARRGETFADVAADFGNALHYDLQREGEAIPLVGLPLAPTDYCMTYLLGRADDTLAWQGDVQLGLQFSQGFGSPGFPLGIAGHFLADDPAYPVRLLLVRGPMKIIYNARNENNQLIHGLDPDNSPEWQDAITATNKALAAYAHNTNEPKRVHLFALGPAVMLYGLGISNPHRGYFKTTLYQYDLDARVYHAVLG